MFYLRIIGKAYCNAKLLNKNFIEQRTKTKEKKERQIQWFAKLSITQMHSENIFQVLSIK